MPGLLDNLLAVAAPIMGAIPGQPQGQAQEPAPVGYEAMLVGFDGDGFTTSAIGTTGVPKEHTAISCPAGVYTEIWAYTVPAQQAITPGWGKAETPFNQGMLYFIATSNHATAPVTYEGMLRIWLGSGRRTRMIPIYEGRTEPLHPSTEDRNNMVMLPSQGHKGVVQEDSLIIVQLCPDATFTLGWGAEITDAGGDCTKLRLPVTIFE